MVIWGHNPQVEKPWPHNLLKHLYVDIVVVTGLRIENTCYSPPKERVTKVDSLRSFETFRKSSPVGGLGLLKTWDPMTAFGTSCPPCPEAW